MTYQPFDPAAGCVTRWARRLREGEGTTVSLAMVGPPGGWTP